MSDGKVFLVGAGPGDPGLITVRGLEVLSVCEVILYDRLANDKLLTYCMKEAELIYVGKEASKHSLPQDSIIDLMIEKARAGLNIVRLKGGDPFIFGRGSEEAMALKNAGIAFEIVPGISAGIGATAYSGIPLTHRNLATQCLFVTAHEAPGKEDSQVDWEMLAKLKHTTLVIYMGATSSLKISEALIYYGMSAHTPTAIIENGTLNTQRTVITKLLNLANEISSHNFKSPLLIIIGETVGLRDKLSWFEHKPLFGKRIVSTRAMDQMQSLSDRLQSLGATVIPFKVIRTELNIPDKPIKEVLKEKRDRIIFTSENGVRYFFELMDTQGLDSRCLAGSEIAAIGSGTASELRKRNIIADFIPKNYTSSALTVELSETVELKGKNILRVKGDFEKDILTADLTKAGAMVETYCVYKLMNDIPDESIINDLIEKGADACLFTSQSTVNNFFSVLGNDNARKILSASIPLAIGPVTAEALTEMGIMGIVQPEVYTIDGMIEKLIKVLGE